MPPHALSRRHSHAAHSHAARSHHTQRTHTQRAHITRSALTRSARPSQVETSTDGADDSKTKEVRVRKAQVCDLPEFDNNPFAPRLCEVFSSDGSGDLYFDELLDLFHALSPKAEREVKVLTAFRVYDFDGDGYLNDEDISTLIGTTTRKCASG